MQKKVKFDPKIAMKILFLYPALQHSSNLMILKVLHAKTFLTELNPSKCPAKESRKKTNIWRARKEKKSRSENVKSNSQGGTATF